MSQFTGHKTDLENLLLIFVIAPIFETLIFQFGVIEITHILSKKSTLQSPVSIILSTLLFSFSHFNGNTYLFANSFLSGVVLATIYFIAMKKNLFPFLSTSLTHLMSNLFVFIMNDR
ncbi:MAG: CPBP family intramembrane metalloprotease [Cyclobacteriaceae bacterium]|nr:CPBP family intramembrane metalloprotease [Cyclobacteriaceae bacterium]